MYLPECADINAVKCLILQTDTLWHDRAGNHRKVEQMLRDCKPQPGSLIVLPESFAMGFTMQIDDTADREDETSKFIHEQSKKYNCTIIAGNMIKPDNKGRNIAIIARPDLPEPMIQTKMHPFTFADEDKYFRGGEHVTVFDYSDTKICPFICYDLRFPEIFRLGALSGTEVFVVIANWPTPRVNHWISLLIARAIENQAYVIGCNRVGSDPKVAYPGRSIIVDPRGQIIDDAGDKESILQANLDLESLRKYRADFPALQDIRFISNP